MPAFMFSIHNPKRVMNETPQPNETKMSQFDNAIRATTYTANCEPNLSGSALNNARLSSFPVNLRVLKSETNAKIILRVKRIPKVNTKVRAEPLVA